MDQGRAVKRRRVASRLARVTLLAVAVLSGARHSLQSAEPVALSGRAMGTTWAVKFLQPAPPLDPDGVRARIAERLERLEQLFSTYRPNSELSRFNRATSTDWVPVSPELATVAARSRRISELTGGAFDATVAPLVALWGFGPAGRIATLPPDSAIAEAQARVDYRRLEFRLNPPALRKALVDVTADFSSMAKGFASDEVSSLLISLHAPDHLVQVGGDLKSHGHPDGSPGWRAGIEQPLASIPSSLATPSPTTPAGLARTVTLSGQALSTSGSGHNFNQIEGHRYGHLIDPATGRPAESALASVSVVAPSCAESSALATALFVLGPERGVAMAARERIAALFILRTEHGWEIRTAPEFQPLAAPSHP